MIWDNYHANDYDIRRVNAGPLGGRSQDLVSAIDGYIANPNNELRANYVPMHTIGQFLSGTAYDETQAMNNAIEDWQASFELAFSKTGQCLSNSQIRLLVELFTNRLTWVRASNASFPNAAAPYRERVRTHRSKLAECD